MGQRAVDSAQRPMVASCSALRSNEVTAAPEVDQIPQGDWRKRKRQRFLVGKQAQAC